MLEGERGASAHTLVAYGRDLREFAAFVHGEGVVRWDAVTPQLARRYVAWLDRRLARSAIARHLSAVRAFFRFLYREGKVSRNPVALVATPRRQRRLPKVLTPDEVQAVLRAPDLSTPVGLRDRAVLEVLYATGMRVGELVAMQLADVQRVGEFRVTGKGRKERIVLAAYAAHEALRRYLQDGRPPLVRHRATEAVFVNARGRPLSDRGVRVILDRVIRRAALTRRISARVASYVCDASAGRWG